MEGSLFEKYKHHIQKNKQEKEIICLLIYQKTGIHIDEKEIHLVPTKKVKIITTSIKKASLIRKNIEKILKEEGYYFSI